MQKEQKDIDISLQAVFVLADSSKSDDAKYLFNSKMYSSSYNWLSFFSLENKSESFITVNNVSWNIFDEYGRETNIVKDNIGKSIEPASSLAFAELLSISAKNGIVILSIDYAQDLVVKTLSKPFSLDSSDNEYIKN